jgi:hypothetical protein
MLFDSINEANLAVTRKVMEAQPFLMDVRPAKEVIPQLEGRVLLHAGPPMKWEEMTDPMQGSCVGAVMFEDWAGEEAVARRMLESGDVQFIPCHHVDAVGPMGGITSGNMPLLVVENKADGKRAYCTMNEGIGKVLRFGAYDADVVSRLRWMRDILGPALSKALRMLDGGMNLNVMIAKAITMGDEFHQRNIAASALFMKEMMPLLLEVDVPMAELKQVTKFLADTDQFFLNIMMATCKVIMDSARTVEEGTIVTALTRNGHEFAIRVSGLGDTWFTAPVNTPEGLFFSGYSQEDVNPDMGDSAITETFGVGGMAMIAAPGVTRFVGAGGFEDAAAISEEMSEICIGRNTNYSIPTWDYQGTCLGIDVRKVVETGITPVINTGMAHKKAGIGQIGAGTVRVPMGCFTKALEALAQKYGVEV